ncbi:MAG: apurinic/apyrimidinic endonuclease family protein [Planctomycetota bacterium]
MNPAFPLALLAATHASVALAAPPSDAEVFSRIRSIQMEYAALEQEDVRKAKQQFRGMIAEMARGFDLAGMTPYQSVVIGPLLDSGALDAGQKRALTEALERAADNDVYGAPALLLLHSLNYWDDPEHTCLVRVFEHPRMAATMAGSPVVRLAIEPGHRRA